MYVYIYIYTHIVIERQHFTVVLPSRGNLGLVQRSQNAAKKTRSIRSSPQIWGAHRPPLHVVSMVDFGSHAESAPGMGREYVLTPGASSLFEVNTGINTPVLFLLLLQPVLLVMLSAHPSDVRSHAQMCRGKPGIEHGLRSHTAAAAL